MEKRIEKEHILFGKISCWLTASIGFIYILVTGLGFLTISSPEEPIRDPFFTMMEFLSILIATLMMFSMTAIHFYASVQHKLRSHIAVIMMAVMMTITSCVHLVVIVMNHQNGLESIVDMDLFFSFKWPSVVYVLDIVAWDWFFAVSFIAAAPIFYKGRLEKIIRVFMFVSGFLSLFGLVGIINGNMQIRNIGIIGYAVLAPLIFLLIGLRFNQISSNPE